MPDKLLVMVPRYVEDEPGYRSSEAMYAPEAALRLSRDEVGQATALREPLSGAWLGQPNAPQSTDGTSQWTSLTGQALAAVSNAGAGGGGVAVTAEGIAASLGATPDPWRVKRAAALERMRGFWLDLFIHQPEDTAHYTLPVRLEWGDRWRLELRGSEQGDSASAFIYEKTGPPEDPWQSVSPAGQPVAWPLLAGPFFGVVHRLWVQPLDTDEFLIRNREHSLGAVVRTKAPVTYDPLDGEGPTDPESEAPVAQAPWDEASPVVSAVPRAWWVLRPLRYPAAWHVESLGPRRLPYLSTQDVTKTLDRLLPDGLLPDDPATSDDDDTASGYAAALTVYEGELDGDEWAADAAGQADYAWRVSVTGPEDAATGWSTRTVVLNRVELEWPATTTLDSSSAVDLFAAADVQVLGLSEQREAEDADSRLTVALRGPRATLAPWAKPNVRVQWLIDTADGQVDGEGEPLPPVYYCRFDGLRDAASEPVFTLVDGTVFEDLSLTVRSRFRQAALQMLRQAVPLDGLSRADAYRKLAEQFPLRTSGAGIELEFEVAFGATRPRGVDDALPSARPRERPAWQPRIGANLLDVLLDLRRTLGTRDRLRIIDRGGADDTRWLRLYIDQPSAASAATFYRSQASANAAGVPGQVVAGGDKLRLLDRAVSDADFYNEIYVVGQDRNDPQKLLVAYAAYPPSWKGPTSDPLYTGARRTLVVVRPELTSQAAVNGVCRDLIEELGRFRSAVVMESYLVPTLYPGDRVTIDAGAEPGAVATLYEIRSMRSQGVALGIDAPWRYRCTYELAEVRP